jgi:hypothetical protein
MVGSEGLAQALVIVYLAVTDQRMALVFTPHRLTPTPYIDDGEPRVPEQSASRGGCRAPVWPAVP